MVETEGLAVGILSISHSVPEIPWGSFFPQVTEYVILKGVTAEGLNDLMRLNRASRAFNSHKPQLIKIYNFIHIACMSAVQTFKCSYIYAVHEAIAIAGRYTKLLYHKVYSSVHRLNLHVLHNCILIFNAKCTVRIHVGYVDDNEVHKNW